MEHFVIDPRKQVTTKTKSRKKFKANQQPKENGGSSSIDEPLQNTTPLIGKISAILHKHGLTEYSPDVLDLVSHAVEERLKTLIEKLGAIAEHRQENIKGTGNYEVVQDVKAQVLFLRDVEQLGKERHEKREREMLLKSRPKNPDLKARLKELQRLEMEKICHREANEAALRAIGFPKARQKTSSIDDSGIGASPPVIKRTKRVTLKDLCFMMEYEKDTVRSPALFRAYAR